MTCKEIFEMIASHTNYLSVFICARSWLNTDDGILLVDDVEKDVLCNIFGDKVPTDWSLCYDDDNGWIKLGFLF